VDARADSADKKNRHVSFNTSTTVNGGRGETWMNSRGLAMNGLNGGGDDGYDDGDDANRESYSPTVMPSEYVRSMDQRDKFDARKMGLSSKTFDDALTAMLNDEVKELGYSATFYDQYARSGPAPRPARRGNSFHRSVWRLSSPPFSVSMAIRELFFLKVIAFQAFDGPIIS
jgi:hypothetical protein